jgi:Dehydratase family
MDARTNIKTRLPSRPLTAAPARAEASLIAVVEIFKKSPDVADLKPAGRLVAADMREVGAIPLLMKTLLDNGQLDGDCITVAGRTIAENLKSVKPIAVSGGVVGLSGNFAPDGAIAEVTGMAKSKFAGPVRCFDAEAEILNGNLTGTGLAGRTKTRARKTNHRSGALWTCAQQVGPAVGGAVTHPGVAHEKQCYVEI